MKTEIKPYRIEIVRYDGFYSTADAVGHFVKDWAFVIELKDGHREIINKDDIKDVFIHKEWQDNE